MLPRMASAQTEFGIDQSNPSTKNEPDRIRTLAGIRSIGAEWFRGGYALARPRSERIVAVMNDIFGKPTNVNLPINLAHMRFPITYTLAENASEEERKAARNALTKSFEGALRTIFESADYKAQVQSAPLSSAHEIAAHRASSPLWRL
jgi:hypothetical protein